MDTKFIDITKLMKEKFDKSITSLDLNDSMSEFSLK